MKKCLLSDRLLKSNLNRMIDDLSVLRNSQSVPYDSALYAFLTSSKTCLEMALNHIVELR